MKRQFFGTDGIRGRANQFPMTVDMAQKVAIAAAHVLKTHETHARVVIGKDTRRSCYMLEQAMASGFLAMGMEVLFLGPLPTPAVASLTRSMRADLGVMISASHNPYNDNGIKLFGADGYKLSDDKELEIEALLAKDDLMSLYVAPEQVGKAKRLEDASGRYVEAVKSTFPKDLTLSGLKIVVDCANGAAYKVAPQVLWELEAKVIPIAVNPNGQNINDDCGAVHTENLQKTVIEQGADIGIALDGDADRLIVVDEKGKRVDGDQLMGALALFLSEKAMLRQDTLVATVMSNLGLERALQKYGIRLIRTAVGDRYVMEAMSEQGASLGGEQSGHIILSDYATTGDGLLAALQILALIKTKGLKASEVLRVFEPVPQILENLVYDPKEPAPLEKDVVKQLFSHAEEDLLKLNGRLLVRVSGTEPKIRVMAEADDSRALADLMQDLMAKLKTALVA
ncbi:MAG: phosphoglucosamine mutase [Micavibrio sp.]|nr:phosphoglucosamine mutase [Micavibrio sp.]